MMSCRFALVAIAVTSLGAVAHPAGAAQTVSCALENAGLGTCLEGNGATVTLDRTYSFLSPTNATASGFARSQAGIGTLKASVGATANTPGGVRNYVGAVPQATARWNDNIIVNAGPRGTRGYFTAVLGVTGILQGGVTGLAEQSANGGISGTAFDFRGTGLSPIGASPFTYEGSYSQSFNVFVPVTIEFFNGFTTSLGYSLGVSANASAGTEGNGSGIQASASSNFGNSVLWGGITGVFDMSGQAVSAYSIVADSNFDYTSSLIPLAPGIPEPASWAMLIAGFGLVGAASRRRRYTLALERRD